MAQEQDMDAYQPKTRRRSIPLVNTAHTDAGLPTLSSDQAAARLGLTWRQLRYMIDQGKIQTIRRGRYWRIPVAEVEWLKRRCQRRPDLKALRHALTMLRAQIQGGAYGSAHRWLNRQRADGQLPRQIFEGLAVTPRAQEWPELLIRIRELLDRLGPETGWDA
jgi:excisionase family DNA binding protein